jgi:restriction system protein
MIPDFQTVMLPILEILSDRKEHSLRELVSRISDRFKLTESERAEVLESGTQTVITSRVGWARTYLTKAGLVSSVRKGVFVITDSGWSIVQSPTRPINVKLLKTLPVFQEWYTSSTSKREESSAAKPVVNEEAVQTPQELLDAAFKKLRDELASEVLETVRKIAPGSFENLVIDLLLKMGYGGSRREAGKIIGKSGDGGVDGVIDEDKLGLDKIYVQAKRYQNPVGISEVRDFAGALLAKQTSKGIFMATSAFPQSAHEFVRSINQRIVLIDGKQLAELMIEHNVGVSVKNTFEIKRLDSDYFEEL